eukprot:365440-Rhodomonas_salina.2
MVLCSKRSETQEERFIIDNKFYLPILPTPGAIPGRRAPRILKPSRLLEGDMPLATESLSSLSLDEPDESAGTPETLPPAIAPTSQPESGAAQSEESKNTDFSAVLERMFTTSTAAVESLTNKRRELEMRKDILESKKGDKIAQSPKMATLSPSGSIDKKLLDSWSKAVVKLNVGGKKIDVRRSTITQVPSRLSWMLSGRWDADLPVDKEGRIFLDFEAAWFDPIINHLVQIPLVLSPSRLVVSEICFGPAKV